MNQVSEHTTRLILDGPLNLPLAGALAIVLAALMGWLLVREAAVIGRPTAWFFWGLRTAAILIVLWMLLAPVRETRERRVTHPVVALVADLTPSMTITDPPGALHDVRDVGEAPRAAQTWTSRALLAAQLAHQRVARARRAEQSLEAEEAVTLQLRAASRAVIRLRHALQQLETPGAASGVTGGQPGSLATASQIREMLRDELLQPLESLAAEPTGSAWRRTRESLSDIEHRLLVIRRQLETLSDEWVTRLRHQDKGDRPGSGASTKVRRVDQVAEYLAAFRRDAALEEHPARLAYYGFDQKLVALPDQQPLDASADSGPPAATAQVPPAAGTDLGALLQAVYEAHSDAPLAAVILLSDMAHNARQVDPLQLARAAPPVYVLPVGNPAHLRDLELGELHAPNVVLKGDQVVIEATVRSYQCDGETCRVELLDGERVVQQRTLELRGQMGTHKIRLETRLDTVGVHQFQMRVLPLEGEVSAANNLQELQVQVVRDKLRILVCDEVPRWEYRYLTQLFRRDAQIVHDELLFRPRIVATGDRAASRSLPATPEQWDVYDLVILGDVSGEHLTIAHQLALVDYVQRKGGAVVLVAGTENMPAAYADQPLSEILPVQRGSIDRSQPLALAITDAGWKYHSLLIAGGRDETHAAWERVNQRAPFQWISEISRPRPAARTLIAALPGSPAESDADGHAAYLCWQPVGRGRVVYLASPESYRLRFLRGDRLHHRFWGQLLRWAAADDLFDGSQRVQIRADRSRYHPGDPVQVTVLVRDQEGDPVSEADVQVEALADSGKRALIPLLPDRDVPGQFVGQLTDLAPGHYRLQPTGPALQAAGLPVNDQPAPESPAPINTDPDNTDPINTDPDNTDPDNTDPDNTDPDNTDPDNTNGTNTNGTNTAADAPAPDRAEIPQAVIDVQERASEELIDTRCDLPLARRLAERTGGQVISPAALSEVLALTDVEPIIDEKVRDRALWPQWKWLWSVFLCLLIEWIIRKRRGLS